MIGYVTLGTNDFAKAADFYDGLLGSIGATRFMEMDTFMAWAVDPGKPMICISKPFDGNEATVGNGCMTAVAMDAQDKVDAFYHKAIELGASDEGKPGSRGDGFYAAYFRDLDGNKLCAFTITS
ncbi:VOC family protein [Pseudoteredinibacter isoporae]|uniref:Putative lactoylglutathione lyase n=1 Tax=Pseudoteredinibacter isoporae TaxID=570281 RepID=A0A7X0JRB3_9GAMM|nr:VOC family protein [Pseudoteredinibacter isoporae]MBB6520349.1 putative lactoylglutathione lyase [Pseudoteredinibacter isoporae]NHO85919.1 VOC family protein [Pseudoteredinibacter isoporae]NIB25629.1 VOC family protein [Pseudoteredinibacter isoporae]